MIHSFHTALHSSRNWAAFEFLVTNSWYRKHGMDSKIIPLHWAVQHFFVLYKKQNPSALTLLYLLSSNVAVDM